MRRYSQCSTKYILYLKGRGETDVMGRPVTAEIIAYSPLCWEEQEFPNPMLTGTALYCHQPTALRVQRRCLNAHLPLLMCTSSWKASRCTRFGHKSPVLWCWVLCIPATEIEVFGTFRCAHAIRDHSKPTSLKIFDARQARWRLQRLPPLSFPRPTTTSIMAVQIHQKLRYYCLLPSVSVSCSQICGMSTIYYVKSSHACISSDL